jgi:hypothetical protein
LLRGDCGFGNEGIMREAEARGRTVPADLSRDFAEQPDARDR